MSPISDAAFTNDLVDPGYSGGDDPFAPFHKNPGTRITLRKHASLTKKGLLDHAFQFPAPPLDEFTRNLVYNWNDYDTIGQGQFSRPSSMQLQTIQFTSIIVADEDGYVYPWAFYNPQNTRGWDTAEVVRELGSILRSATPFYLIAEEARFKANTSGSAQGISYDFGTTPLIRMLATLRTVTSTDRAGEPDARYVTVGFTEFRSADAEQRSAGGAGAGSGSGTNSAGKGGPGSSKLPTTIGLKAFKDGPKPPASDLAGLATFYYGSASQWTQIKGANPWLGNVTASHDLSDWNTNELKSAGKANRRLTLPVLAQGGRQ